MSDSNAPDIKLKIGKQTLFNIETKERIAQAGQFVILSNDKRYELSQSNKTDPSACQPIIDFINQDYQRYAIVKQNSLSVECPYDLIINRITSFYKKEKETEHLITIDNQGRYVILNVDDLSLYFDIECQLRRKKSGSQNIPKSAYQEVEEVMKSFAAANNIKNYKIMADVHDYLKFITTDKRDFGQKKLQMNSFTLYILKRRGNEYILRKLSATNNPNIIFTLKLKKNHPGTQLTSFIKRPSQTHG